MRRSSDHSTTTGAPDSRSWGMNLFLLWQGLFASGVGDALYQLSVGFFVLRLTGSATKVGLLLGLNLCARVAAYPVAGVVVDRLDRRNVLVWTDLLRGSSIVLLSISIGAGVFSIWHLVGVAILTGIGDAFFSTAAYSFVPDLVPEHRLVRVNATVAMARKLSAIVGNSIGGLLFSHLDPAAFFAINGALFLVSGMTELLIKNGKGSLSGTQATGFFERLRDGFKIVLSDRGMSVLFAAMAIVNVIVVGVRVILVQHFETTTRLGSGPYGLMIGAQAFGATAAFVLVGMKGIPSDRRWGVVLTLSLLYSMLTAILILPKSIVALGVLFFLWGIPLPVINALVITLVQTRFARGNRGRVFAVSEMLTFTLLPIGYVLGGGVADSVSAEVAMFGSGILLLAMLSATWLVPTVRTLLVPFSDGQE
jgi:DHA3 family macrolide efflux protein-like MFS transporter